jgi:hypothetical protein
MASAFTDSPIVRRRAIGAGVGAIAGGAGAEENIRIKRAEGKRYNVAQRAALIGAGAFGGSMVGAWVGGMSTGVAKAAVKTAKRLRKGDFGTTGELATLAGTGTLGAGLSYREEKKKGHGPLSKGMAIVGGGAMGVLGGTVIGPAVTHFGGMAGIKAGKKAKAAYGAGRAAASAKYSNITQAVLRRMKQNRVTPQSKALVKYKGGR